MRFNVLSLNVVAAMIGLASATCQMSNIVGTSDYYDPGPSDALCLNQGEGQWTFAMYVTLTVVPDLSGSAPLAGAAGGTEYFIYDNNCNIMSAYQQPSCGIPWIIEENFLTDVLTITDVDEELGDAYYRFTYGNGAYSIDNNHCVCNGMSSGLTGEQGCRCAFPVDGIFTG
jgi:hypothetical protein